MLLKPERSNTAASEMMYDDEAADTNNSSGFVPVPLPPSPEGIDICSQNITFGVAD